MFSAYRYTG